jgi:hypothetical protein
MATRAFARGDRRGRLVELGDRDRHFIALPARELLVDEINGERAVLADHPLPRELVDVVPPVFAEHADDERSAELLAHLGLGLANLELVHHVLGQVVALVDVEHVDAVGAQRRKALVDRLAAGAGEHEGGDYGDAGEGARWAESRGDQRACL